MRNWNINGHLQINHFLIQTRKTQFIFDDSTVPM